MGIFKGNRFHNRIIFDYINYLNCKIGIFFLVEAPGIFIILKFTSIRNKIIIEIQYIYIYIYTKKKTRNQ